MIAPALRQVLRRWAVAGLLVIATASALAWARSASPRHRPRRVRRSAPSASPSEPAAKPLNQPGGEFKDLRLAAMDLRGANAARATLANVDLTGANLAGASFSRSFLSFVNLEGANLAGADFRRCAYDRFTRWPAGFDPRAAAAIRIGPAALRT